MKTSTVSPVRGVTLAFPHLEQTIFWVLLSIIRHELSIKQGEETQVMNKVHSYAIPTEYEVLL